MQELAVTAIGADRPGIVAAVAAVLREHGGNVEDSAMTILGGQFAMMLLVATETDPDTLHAALESAGAEMGLTITLAAVGAGHDSPAPTHVLSVYGSDKPGILAGVSHTLAHAGANITDLETRLLSADDDPVYAMAVELVIPEAVGVEAIAQALAGTCTELGVDHTLRPLDTTTY